MSFTDVRKEIAVAISQIKDLHVSAYRPSPLDQTPCAFIVPERIEYGYTLPRRNQKNYFIIQILFGRMGDFSESQATIDEYLDYSGDKSIYNAVDAYEFDKSLVNHVHLEGMTEYGIFDYDGTPYVGARFRVETY